MGDYLGLVWTNLNAYVFGNYVYFGMFMLVVITIGMYRMNLPIDAMMVAWLPILYMMAWSSYGLAGATWIYLLSAIVLGFVLILVGKKMIGR